MSMAVASCERHWHYSYTGIDIGFGVWPGLGLELGLGTTLIGSRSDVCDSLVNSFLGPTHGGAWFRAQNMNGLDLVCGLMVLGV